MKTLMIPQEDIGQGVTGKSLELPKYCSFMINQANRVAQSTRPKVVGQMSDLIREFRDSSGGRSYDAWVRWYLEREPRAIDNATDMAYSMVAKFREAIEGVDREMVKSWVEDLVLAKTYYGFFVQDMILARVAGREGCSYRLSNPKEESQGIDGFIGDVPVSVKPRSYLTKATLDDAINAKVIYYRETKEGISVEYNF